MYMNAHALGLLEFPRILDVVAGRASSEAGAGRVRELRPVTDREWIEAEQARVTAMRALVSGEPRWVTYAVPNAGRVLERLRVEGATLASADLLTVRTVLRSSRLTREALRDPRRALAATAVLQVFVGRLIEATDAEGAIERTIDDEGNVRDGASPRLREIRRELRGAEGALVALLERVMSRLESHQQVPDMSVTVRNGRYVIPVRREARAVIGGIVHDSSSTGATVFVEPPAAIEAGNRIRELEAEEAAEIERILFELTELLRPRYEGIAAAFDALVELDSLYARARFAEEFSCMPAELCDPGDGFRINAGRHPLLAAQGVRVIPFDLALAGDERTLLISGPNTGGKTVLLKAVALLSVLTQSGIPVPVGRDSHIAIVDDIFADIGDEQSIAASLSTFSAHVKNLAEILAGATDRTLVLIDELGSGTDPVEGAALGGAVLEALTERSALTIATTHLGALKELAFENPRVVNASLQFDPVALAPTYRLIKGIPGRSYGLSIARRLSLPEDVVARAEQRLPTGERDASQLLANLEARETALAEREREAAVIANDARERARRVAERERTMGIRERDAERKARQDARRYLLAARREVESTIQSLKAAAGPEAVEAAARAARHRVEALATEQNTGLERLDVRDRGARPAGSRPPREAERPVVGDYVEVDTLGGRAGQLVEIRDDDGVVAVGPLKLTLPLTQLRKTMRSAAPTVSTPVRGDVADIYAPSEIDLRGMRVGEIDDIVMHAVDNAVRADLKAIRIIHGKGTGALRERVNEMLRKEPRVANFRLGAWNEGGAGVTVVEFA